MNFLWDFGSTLQDPNKLYTNTGILDSVYLIELISESMHGCKDTFVDSITIHPDARADFNPTSSAGCAPLTLDSTLIGLTQYPLANDTYSWTIFASNSSTVLSSFNGTSFTNYTMANDNDTTYVRLITSNNYGCKNDTIVKRFITIQDPQADFTLSDSTGCGNTQITLSDASTPSGLALNWSFGDGDSSTATNPTHTFNNTSNTQDSTYNITLIATAGTGCSDTITKSITIHPLPKALFTLSSTASCAPATITSTNTSAHKTGAWSSLWTSSHASVGINNTTDSTPTFSFVDNDSGVDTTYTLSLLVTSIDGCKDSISDTLRVYSRPNAIFSIDTGSCGGLSLTPDNNTDTSSVFLHDYLWTINPSSGVTLDDTLYEPSIFMPVNNTTSAISYTILLTATSPQGCVDTYLDSTIVYPKPLASFSYALPDSCSPDTAYFTNTSNPYNSEAITSMNFLWDFGSTLQDPNKLYTNTQESLIAFT